MAQPVQQPLGLLRFGRCPLTRAHPGGQLLDGLADVGPNLVDLPPQLVQFFAHWASSFSVSTVW